MTIRDKKLHPYIIKASHNSYDVYEEVKPKGKPVYEKPIGYFTTLDNALKRISRLHLSQKNKELDLSQYLKELNKANKAIIKAVEGIELSMEEE